MGQLLPGLECAGGVEPVWTEAERFWVGRYPEEANQIVKLDMTASSIFFQMEPSEAYGAKILGFQLYWEPAFLTMGKNGDLGRGFRNGSSCRSCLGRLAGETSTLGSWTAAQKFL